jgi:hypothetical protein
MGIASKPAAPGKLLTIEEIGEILHGMSFFYFSSWC